MLKKLQQLQKLVVCLILVTLFTFSSFRPAFASSSDVTSLYLTDVSPKTSAKEVLKKYNIGSGFSGVYNLKTKQWMALPSEDGTSLESREDISSISVPRKEGHRRVEEKFLETIFPDLPPDINCNDRNGDIEVKEFCDNNVGFFIELKNEKNLGIRWLSTVINCRNFKISREAPLDYKKKIRNAIKEKTDYEVRDLPVKSDVSCPKLKANPT